MSAMPDSTASSGLTDAPGAESEHSALSVPVGLADVLVLSAIVVLWGLIAIAVNPVGDFPLNDDWAYGLPVKWLVETGQLRLTDWGAMTLITQVFWGALFASIAGFSFTVLRISTLLIAAVGLVLTYLVGRQVGLPRWLAMVVTGLFVVNPIFISLSQTFLTDVPFWSLMILAIFLLLRGLPPGHQVSYWAGWMTVLAAILLRQLALAIPIGLVIALAIKDGLGRSWLIRVVVPSVAMFAVVFAYPKVMQSTIGLPANYAAIQNSIRQVGDHLIHLRLGALKPFVYGCGNGLMHLGWWMLPLLVLLPSFRGAGDRAGKVVHALLIAGGSAAVITAILWAGGRLMPLGSIGCILVDLGTGPQTMSGEPPRAPVLFWVAFTAVSAFGAVLLVLALASIARRRLVEFLATRNPRPLWLPVFLVTVGAALCITWSHYGPWVDRYVLLDMGLLGLLIAMEAVRSSERLRPSIPQIAAAVTLALVYLGFGVVSTHDYLAWNRARWEAGRSLLTAGDTTLADILGGFEFDAYHYWRDRPEATYMGVGDPNGYSYFKRAANSQSRFVLSFSELPAFTVVSRFPVGRWMRYSPGEVVILRRNAVDAHD